MIGEFVFNKNKKKCYSVFERLTSANDLHSEIDVKLDQRLVMPCGSVNNCVCVFVGRASKRSALNLTKKKANKPEFSTFGGWKDFLGRQPGEGRPFEEARQRHAPPQEKSP